MNAKYNEVHFQAASISARLNGFTKQLTSEQVIKFLDWFFLNQPLGTNTIVHQRTYWEYELAESIDLDDLLEGVFT